MAGADGVVPFRAGFDTAVADPGFGGSTAFEATGGLEGGCILVANVVSATALFVALGRTGTALGLVATESRAAGRCSGAGRGDGTLLEASAALLVEGWRNKPPAFLFMAAPILAEGACFSAVTTGEMSGIANVVSATPMATGEPCNATVLAAWDSVATTNDTPWAGSDSGGVHGTFLEASAALSEDGCPNKSSLIMVASILAKGACVTAVSTGRLSGMANVVSGTGEPSNATVSAVGNSLVTMKDSPRAGSGSGGVLLRLPSSEPATLKRWQGPSVALSEARRPVSPAAKDGD